MFAKLRRQKEKNADTPREIKRNIDFGRRVAKVHQRIAAEQRQDVGTKKLDQKAAVLLTKLDPYPFRLYP